MSSGSAGIGERIVGAKLGDHRAIGVAHRGEAKSVTGAGNDQAPERRVDDRVRDFRAGAAGSVRGIVGDIISRCHPAPRNL
jgi:hypothetical protein